MIEIGKSILQEAKVLILDEPTSSLGEQETKELFKTVNLLKEQGWPYFSCRISWKRFLNYVMCYCYERW